MSSTHEQSIKYLDYILNEEERRHQNDSYGHQWRNFTISRSGRFKTKNKHRDGLFYGKVFEQQSFNHINTKTNANTSTTTNKNVSGFGNSVNTNGYKNVSDKDMAATMNTTTYKGCKHTDV